MKSLRRAIWMAFLSILPGLGERKSTFKYEPQRLPPLGIPSGGEGPQRLMNR
jgi:hypothetical protein